MTSSAIKLDPNRIPLGLYKKYHSVSSKSALGISSIVILTYKYMRIELLHGYQNQAGTPEENSLCIGKVLSEL